jgi:glycosyltransferase involved in cell wall biosynthesis
MSEKRISVIIPTYQHARTIAATLDSVFSQTRHADEVIVVNDGSTDGTEAVLAKYAGRVRVITQENRGGNPARNAGFEASTGDYVLFCDADVIMRPDMLERMADLLDAHPEAGYVYGGFRFGWKKFRSFPFSETRLRRMNFIHTTSLIRRADFPGFDPAIRRLQDWDVWLTMLERGKPGLFVDEELFVIQDEHGRRGISQWRPSIMYRIPWKRFGWKPESIRRYDDAFDVIARKHGL